MLGLLADPLHHHDVLNRHGGPARGRRPLLEVRCGRKVHQLKLVGCIGVKAVERVEVQTIEARLVSQVKITDSKVSHALIGRVAKFPLQLVHAEATGVEAAAKGAVVHAKEELV